MMSSFSFTDPITLQQAYDHGLSHDEYEKMLQIMQRVPNLIELGIFSVMWSEHCSYKSSKKWLKTLPTQADWVIQGPGENAGVIDIGDDDALVFKMESHNHPSFIEPYQGAATGVGGIMRDVFTMGARPIANLNALFFGDASHERTPYLLEGVVQGIGDYGNCMGVPTVGGQTRFHPAYNGNILVNAMTVGLAKKDKIFYSRAKGDGYPVVYIGAKTGRDGIHGATMASSEFDDQSQSKRPTVQVGDPFTEKLLLEACQELMATDMIVAIQDMGAAGLTSSSFEMACHGGMGVELWLDQVPMREEAMTPYELMLSESQERMLLILKPGCEKKAQDILKKWMLDFAVIGSLNTTKTMRLMWHGQLVGDLPIDPLADASPEYDRPYIPTPAPEDICLDDIQSTRPPCDVLKDLLGSVDLCSRQWIWQQYDYSVMGDTLKGPGGNAAVVRVHGQNKAVAFTTSVTGRYCFADPFEGGRQAVAQSYRQLICVGGQPKAVTDNLNFGNPERPEVMGQIVGCIQGISQACATLETPVVSGNVSLYNETNGKGILPTPTIGAVGVVSQLEHVMDHGVREKGDCVILLGRHRGHLGQSLYLAQIHGQEKGTPPPVDLKMEKMSGDVVHGLIKNNQVHAVHTLSSGGLYVALAQMALRGGMGMDIHMPHDVHEWSWLFGEDQGCYLLACQDEKLIMEKAKAQGLSAQVVAHVGGEYLTLNGQHPLCLKDLKRLYDQGLDGIIPRHCEAEVS